MYDDCSAFEVTLFNDLVSEIEVNSISISYNDDVAFALEVVVFSIVCALTELRSYESIVVNVCTTGSASKLRWTAIKRFFRTNKTARSRYIISIAFSRVKEHCLNIL